MRTLRSLRLVCALTALAAAACGGDDGDPGPAGPPGPQGPPGEGSGGTGAGGGGGPTDDPSSVNGITPSSAFLARSLQVTVSGDDTVWADPAPTVSFGDGVTVDEVKVASPTALLVTVTIAENAALGAHDVVVGTGEGALTYTGGFTIDSPLDAVVDGTIAQGSVAFARLAGKDFDTPFDTTSTGDGFFTPLVYTNISIDAGAGVSGQATDVQPYVIQATMFFDLDAAEGAHDLSVDSGPAGEVPFPRPAALDVEARTPVDLTDGLAGTAPAPLGSILYRLTPPDALGLLELSVSSTEAAAAPGFALLPESGKWIDLFGVSGAFTLGVDGSAGFYPVFLDTSGAAAYPFDVSVVTTAAASGGPEVEPNDTALTANSGDALPYMSFNATLSSATDVDWFEVPAALGDVNKSFRVRTVAGQPQTDPVVEVFFINGTTTLGGESDDNNYHEDWLSDPIPAPGTYLIKVTASSFFSPTQDQYSLFVETVDAD